MSVINRGFPISKPKGPAIKQPQARVTHSVNQTVTSGAAPLSLSFDTERWDNDAIHDNATNNSRLTAQTAGLYVITGHIMWSSNATGFRRVQILLNGLTTIGDNLWDTTSGDQMLRMFVTTQYQLNVSDFVELAVEQDSGGNLTIFKSNERSPEFMMTKISDF